MQQSKREFYWKYYIHNTISNKMESMLGYVFDVLANKTANNKLHY